MVSPLISIDRDSLNTLFKNGKINEYNFSKLMEEEDFLHNPFLYEAALQIVTNYKDPSELKSVMRAYEVLNCNKVASLPTHNIRFYDYWTKSNFTSVLNSAEKIMENNFAQSVQAKTEMYVYGVELEKKINDHIDSIEGMVNSIGAGVDEWNELKKALIQNREGDAIGLWNNLIAKLRVELNFKSIRDVERVLLDPLQFINSLPPNTPVQARFLAQLPALQKEVKRALDNNLKGAYEPHVLKNMDDVVKNQWFKTCLAYIKGDPEELKKEVTELVMHIYLRENKEDAPNLLSSFNLAAIRFASRNSGFLFSDLPSKISPDYSKLDSIPLRPVIDPNLIDDNYHEKIFNNAETLSQNETAFYHLITLNQMKGKNDYFQPIVLDKSIYYTSPPPRLDRLSSLTHLDFYKSLKDNHINTIVDLHMNFEEPLTFMPTPLTGRTFPIPGGGEGKYLSTESISIPGAYKDLAYIVKSQVEVSLDGSKDTYTVLQVKYWSKDLPPDPKVLKALQNQLSQLETVGSPRKTVFLDVNSSTLGSAVVRSLAVGPRASAFVLYQHFSKLNEAFDPFKALIEMKTTVNPQISFEAFTAVLDAVKANHRQDKGIAAPPTIAEDKGAHIETLLELALGNLLRMLPNNSVPIMPLLQKFLDITEPEKARVEQTLLGMLVRASEFPINYVQNSNNALIFLLLQNQSYSFLKDKIVQVYPEYKDADPEKILSVLDNPQLFLGCFPEYRNNLTYSYIVYLLKEDNQPSNFIDVLRYAMTKHIRPYDFVDFISKQLNEEVGMEMLFSLDAKDVQLIPEHFFEKYLKRKMDKIPPGFTDKLSINQGIALGLKKI